jgi:hypothetical protein
LRRWWERRVKRSGPSICERTKKKGARRKLEPSRWLTVMELIPVSMLIFTEHMDTSLLWSAQCRVHTIQNPPASPLL